MLLTKQQVHRQVKPRYRDESFPELGGEIRFVEMMADEWHEFDKEGPFYSLRLFIAGARDATGKRLYDEDEINKLVTLYPMHIWERGAVTMLKLNGLIRDKDAEKNSRPEPPSTESQPPSA